MPTPLGQLLRESTTHLRTHILAIAIAAIVIGLLQATMQGLLGQKIKGGIEGVMNIDPSRMEELQKRLEAGDQAVLQELQQMMQGTVENESKTIQDVSVFLRAFPFFAISLLTGVLLSLIGSYYFFFVALESGDALQNIKRAFEYFFPLVGLSVWIYLRSFLWIPFIGFALAFVSFPAFLLSVLIAVILGAIFMPRFILSNVILVRNRRGILESAQASYEQTRGYWGKIVGNMIVARLLSYICLMVVIVVLAFAARPAGPFIGSTLAQIAAQGMVAFLVIFKTKLAITLLAEKKAVA
jgi:hypothetical protein